MAVSSLVWKFFFLFCGESAKGLQQGEEISSCPTVYTQTWTYANADLDDMSTFVADLGAVLTSANESECSSASSILLECILFFFLSNLQTF